MLLCFMTLLNFPHFKCSNRQVVDKLIYCWKIEIIYKVIEKGILYKDLYKSMLVCWFVSLSTTGFDGTILHRQLKVIQTDTSTCLHNILCPPDIGLWQCFCMSHNFLSLNCFPFSKLLCSLAVGLDHDYRYSISSSRCSLIQCLFFTS